jgi:hypothetical protein
MLHLLGYVHLELSHLITKELSAMESKQPQQPVKAVRSNGLTKSSRSPEVEVHTSHFKNGKLPYSLYVRANLLKDEVQIVDWNKILLPSVLDSRWCMDSFKLYSQQHLKLMQNFRWPSCLQAYGYYNSRLLLTWARKNGCSCTFDMRNLPPLYSDEIATLNGLLQNARTFYNDKHFSKRDGLIESMQSNGSCLFSTYMRGKSYIPPAEDVDEDDILEACFYKQDITQKAAMEFVVCPSVVKCPFQFPKNKTTYVADKESFWTYQEELNKLVTSKDVIIYPGREETKVISKLIEIRYSIAITIFAHATRLVILGNPSHFKEIPRKWNKFMSHISGFSPALYKDIKKNMIIIYKVMII